MERVEKFLTSEEGGEMPEYAVVVGIIIIVGAAVFILIGSQINTIFHTLSGVLEDAGGGTTSP